MKFLADESIDAPVVEGLRRAGHSVAYIAEMIPGIEDETVLNLSKQTSALLLTADREFSEVVFRQRRIQAGIVLVRLPGESPAEKAVSAVDAVANHDAEFHQAFTVISPSVVRVRKTIK